MTRLALLLVLLAASAAALALPSRSSDEHAGKRVVVPRLAQDAGTTTDDVDALADRPGPLAVFEPVAPVTGLMTGMSGGLSRIRDALDAVEERNRFDRIAGWSGAVAELANVVVLHGGDHDEDQAWRDMAADTRELALGLAAAARADTVDELLLVTLADRIDASCQACHDADY